MHRLCCLWPEGYRFKAVCVIRFLHCMHVCVAGWHQTCLFSPACTLCFCPLWYTCTIWCATWLQSAECNVLLTGCMDWHLLLKVLVCVWFHSVVASLSAIPVIFGEDVAFGGVFKCTEGLQSRYGTCSVRVLLCFCSFLLKISGTTMLHAVSIHRPYTLSHCHKVLYKEEFSIPNWSVFHKSVLMSHGVIHSMH